MVEVMILRAEKEIGMGCCGGVCSDKDALVHMEDEFKHHDEDRQNLGELYRKTMTDYGDQVEITFLDPRNVLAITVYFLKQVKERQISPFTACRHFFFHMKYNAIFVNGRMVDGLNDYHTQLRKVLNT
ncbi:hypothetical protein [Halobacillus mangrovi]|uniref:Uncharacterized protein n=1 Tax=Halobacillus mangrovi TaxID=402384 RepID=A0A1W5ZTB1_9BACI|nr:hypothetical protein [Halobacillus mangrovi]ARI76487.1 hypothetical protein HM131_06390 [Halobacillus mangrovi]